MTWKHFPNSPFGDIDICEHGCTREHGSTKKECIICDYSKNAKLQILPCAECKSIGTWHVNGKCIPCSQRRKAKVRVVLI